MNGTFQGKYSSVIDFQGLLKLSPSHKLWWSFCWPH